MRSRRPQCKALAVAPGATCATAKTRKKRSTPMRACFVQIEWPISGRELASEYDPTACRSHRHIFRCLFSFASFQRSHLPCHLNQCLPVWGSSRKERILFSAVQSKKHCFAFFSTKSCISFVQVSHGNSGTFSVLRKMHCHPMTKRMPPVQ